MGKDDSITDQREDEVGEVVKQANIANKGGKVRQCSSCEPIINYQWQKKERHNVYMFLTLTLFIMLSYDEH